MILRYFHSQVAEEVGGLSQWCDAVNMLTPENNFYVTRWIHYIAFLLFDRKILDDYSLGALRCAIFPFIATSCCGATFDKDAIDVTSLCALYGKSAVVEVMCVFLFITTSRRPYLLLML